MRFGITGTFFSNNHSMSLLGFIVSLLLGGACYVLLELIWRSRSHISMFLAGGICCALLAGLYVRFSPPPALRFILSAAVITAVEFIAGYILNIRLNMRVWDYSDLRHNLYGQISLSFSLLWGLMALPISLASKLIAAL